MKPVLFRFKIASWSLCISGLLVIGFGVFFLVTISRVGMARIDEEIRALGEGQIRGPLPADHWSNFDRSLNYIYGDEPKQRIAVRVLDAGGGVLFTSADWSEELNDIHVPQLVPPSVLIDDRAPGPAAAMSREDDFIQRLDVDGDNRVSAEEFDGPPDHFADFDANADGYLTHSESPRHPSGREPPMADGRPRGPGGFERQLPPRRGAPVRQPPQARLEPMVPVFQTHKTSAGEWRVGFMGNQSITLIVAADLAELHREISFFRNAFLIATPVALILLGLGGWLLASRALRPVTIITRTAESITARGLGKRVATTTSDAELRRLVDVINGMLDRLERSFHQAARFSADAAHELQTPLTVLQGELDNAVQQASPGSEEQQRYSGLLEEVQGLKAIVQKLLLLARTDVGCLPLSLDDVDLSALIQSAVEDVETLAPNLTVETEIATGIQIKADADLMGQVIRNMTSNAVKYSKAKGTVRFNLRAQDTTVLLTVANTADAIPDDDRPKLFDRFYRVDKARSREIRGSGLGLSLAREIARAHGGDLVLDPEQGDMVSFTLSLPASLPPSHPDTD